jgi:hypothetical protein
MANIVFVQSVFNSLQSGSFSAITLSITTTSPNGVVHGCVAWNDGAGRTISSISDGTSNAYNIVDALHGTSGSRFFTHFVAKNVPPGAYIITVTFSGSTSLLMLAAKEFANASTGTLDQHTAQVQTTPTTATGATTSGPTAALNAQPAMISGWCFSTQYSGATDFADTGAGFSSDTSQAFTTMGNFLVGENKRVTSTAAVSATFTSGGNFEHTTAVLVIDEASAAGGASGSRQMLMGVG